MAERRVPEVPILRNMYGGNGHRNRQRAARHARLVTAPTPDVDAVRDYFSGRMGAVLLRSYYEITDSGELAFPR